jgi:ABC-2 type transport system ATP-binding protein
VIEAQRLTKRYGDKLAVDELSFTVRPGVVTGFLGPNGSGKSTTMRMVMGLDAPNAGDVTVNGQHYHDLAWPLREVGALLEAKAIHPGRSARAHLRMLAEANRIPLRRVEEVLELVGLSLDPPPSDGANLRLGTKRTICRGFSMGLEVQPA